MGSTLTRYMRDLSEVGGFVFEEVDGSLPTVSESKRQTLPESVSHPCTPVANKTVHVLDLDPRSPTAEIVRTPIEVISNFSRKMSENSPMSSVFKPRRSYLETDLDTLSTSEFSSKPDSFPSEPKPMKDPSLPPGLTCAHLLKLKFLGMDPRSPSSDVVRTPIQLSKEPQKEASFHFDDTLSVGSVSSQDIFCNSNCSSDFTRDCSDPSAFISENEDYSDKEDELTSSSILLESDAASEEIVATSSNTNNELCVQVVETTPKTSSKLIVFQENSCKSSETVSKPSPATPEAAKKPAGNRSRTPLTPLCNRNKTPNSILRAKQALTIEKEILTKANIYYTEENVMTPSKKSSSVSCKKENVAGRPSHKAGVENDENTCLSISKKRVLSQWDQDSSVII